MMSKMFSKYVKTAFVGVVFALLNFGVAQANVISIADGGGTITCTGSVDPACLAFTGGASGGLGTEPDSAGTLIDGTPSTELAWYYDGTPSGPNDEATRLNTLIGSPTFSATDAIKTDSPPNMFSTLAEYVVLKLGNMSVFIKNNTGGMLTITLDTGPGFGLSHYTEFGQVSDVPLPGAVWLMIAGVAGLGAASRKKKAA